MAIIGEVAVAELFQGLQRQKLILHRSSYKQKRHVLSFGGHPFFDRCFASRPQIVLKGRAVVPGAVPSVVDEESIVGELIHFYRVPLIQDSARQELLKLVQQKVSHQIIDIKTEQCFNVEVSDALSREKLGILKWLLGETYEPDNLQTESFLDKERSKSVFTVLVEVGPRMSFTAAWSANAVSICQSCTLTEVTRMERSRRYLLYLRAGSGLSDQSSVNEFAAMIHDRMTGCVYPSKLVSFRTSVVPEAVIQVPVIERGREALEDINEKMGLAFDEQDIQYYTRLFGRVWHFIN